jgi:amidase
MPALHYLDLLEIARLVQSREISAVEVTRSQLERVAALDPTLASYALVTAESALQQAREVDREISAGLIRGPLHGAPIAVKDVFWTRGIVTAAGTRVHARFIPNEDATAVARLRAAGTILLGKLTTAEAGYSIHHPDIREPVNPWNAELWCGASSSGSGVATAAGLCFGSLGTDAGGSVRLPAALNGIVGLKPTWGRVSGHGVIQAAPSLEHVGPLARSVADVAAMFHAIEGPNAGSASPADQRKGALPSATNSRPPPIRLGFDPKQLQTVDEATRNVVGKAIATLSASGGELHEVKFPLLPDLGATFAATAGPEMLAAHAGTFPSRRSDYSPGLASFLDAAADMDPAVLKAARRARDAFAIQMNSLFNAVDALILPVTAIARLEKTRMQRLGEDLAVLDAITRFTSPFNLCGLPALVLPGGANADGSPISFQIAAGALREDQLFALGHRFQAETDWHCHHPDLTG